MPTSRPKLKVVVFAGRILGYRGLELVHRYADKVQIDLFVPSTNLGEKGSDWNPQILPLAKKYGLKILRNKSLKDSRAVAQIAKVKPDLILNLFCNRIITKEILAIPRLGAINFHYGKLPKYRGRFIVTNIILNNEKETCATAHYIEEGIDTGDIIFENKVKIERHDTAKSLYLKCTDAALDLIERVLKATLAGRKLPHRKQRGQAGYFPFQEPNQCQVELKWNQDKIERFIRAVTFEPISAPLLKIGNLQFKIIPDSEKSI